MSDSDWAKDQAVIEDEHHNEIILNTDDDENLDGDEESSDHERNARKESRKRNADSTQGEAEKRDRHEQKHLGEEMKELIAATVKEFLGTKGSSEKESKTDQRSERTSFRSNEPEREPETVDDLVISMTKKTRHGGQDQYATVHRNGLLTTSILATEELLDIGRDVFIHGVRIRTGERGSGLQCVRITQVMSSGRIPKRIIDTLKQKMMVIRQWASYSTNSNCVGKIQLSSIFNGYAVWIICEQ